MARLKSVCPTRFKSTVISKLLERLPALQPWPKDTRGLYTKPPSSSEVKAGIWLCLEDYVRRAIRSRKPHLRATGLIGGDSKEYSHARDVILEYLVCNFPRELEHLLRECPEFPDDDARRTVRLPGETNLLG